MKYKVLKQIPGFLSRFRKIASVRRVGDCAIEITFEGNSNLKSNLDGASGDNNSNLNCPKKITLVFDLAKSGSSVYLADPSAARAKDYKAPFDGVLAKRFTASKIVSVEVPDNNRILHIHARFEGSYKAYESHLYLEFTGRFTNAIITDENGVILEALRHFSTDFRDVAVGRELRPLEPIEIKEGDAPEITDFPAFFAAELARVKDAKIAGIRAAKLAGIDKKISNLNEVLAALESENELSGRAAYLAEVAGEITANLWKMSGKERSLDLVIGGKPLHIDLTTTPQAHANALFKESKKLRQKAANVNIQRSNLNEKITFLRRLCAAARACESADELEIILPRARTVRKEKRDNGDLVQNFFVGEHKISVGKNERGNAWLLANAKKDDFWFHLQGRASAHVIVRTPKKTLPEEVIALAARLCVQFSEEERGSYQVDFTRKMNVKIVGGAFVNYVNYSTIGVKI